jgi:hypothetical protein
VLLSQCISAVAIGAAELASDAVTVGGAAGAGGASASDVVMAGDGAVLHGAGAITADGADMAWEQALASVQAGAMVVPMRPLLVVVAAAASTSGPAAAAAAVFSAVFSNSVELTVPRGGRRRSKDTSRFEPF